MPLLNINGTNIFYEETGSGPETIVFSHGLLMSGEMFSAQVRIQGKLPLHLLRPPGTIP